MSRPDRAGLDRIFGTELPQESSDEVDPGVVGSGADRDEWLLGNVPPHHR